MWKFLHAGAFLPIAGDEDASVEWRFTVLTFLEELEEQVNGGGANLLAPLADAGCVR